MMDQQKYFPSWQSIMAKMAQAHVKLWDMGSWTSGVVVNLDDIGNLVSLGAAGARRGTEE
jgi:hypothetical protein